VIAVVILSLIHASLEAWREAVFYHVLSLSDKSDAPSIKVNEHTVFAVQRLIVGVAILALCPSVQGVILLVAIGLLWSAVHDSVYYRYRNRFNRAVYQKGWRSSNSGTGTAWFNPGFKVRVGMVALGLMLLYEFIWFNSF